MASGSESPSESQLYVHDDDTESTASAPATSSAEPASTTDSHSLCSAGDPGSSSDRRQRGRGRGGRGTGRFKRSWKLPPYIAGSKRGTKYAYCKLCSSNFDISHGGFNDIKATTNRLVGSRPPPACLPAPDSKRVLILIKRNFKYFSRGGLLRNGVRDADFRYGLHIRFFLLKNASGVDNIGRRR